MWPIEHTEMTSAAPAAVWALWEDVPGWVRWDEGLDAISLEGAFEVGARGKIKPTGGPSFPFTLIAVDAGRAFTDETKLPLCRLRFAHSLETTDDGRTAITLRVSFHGLLKPLFQRVIGKDIAADLAPQMARLARVAEGASEGADTRDAPRATTADEATARAAAKITA